MKTVAERVPSGAKTSSYGWVVLVTWMFSHMWAFMMIESLGLLLPSIRADLGLSPLQEGWLGSAPHIGNLILAIPSGVFFSKFSPKPLTSVTMILGTLLMLFQGWAPGFAVLVLGRFLYGLTIVAREPARTLLIRQWVEPREIVIANSIVELLWGVGGAFLILIPVILKLLDDSWRNTFYLFAGISLLLTVVWQIIGRERVTSEYVTEIRSQARNPISTILRYRELWFLAIGTVGMGISFSAMSTFWPSFMLDTYEVSLTKVATVRAIGSFVAAPGALAIGVLVSRVGKKKTLLVIFGLMSAISYVGMLYTDSFLYLTLISIANSSSFASFPIIMTIPYELPGIRPREVAVGVALVRSFIMAGAIIGPLLSGALHQATDDLRLALIVTSLMTLTVAVAGLLLPGRWNRVTGSDATPTVE